jgi:hypothetical protein
MALFIRGWLFAVGDGALATLAAVGLGGGVYFSAALALRAEEAISALSVIRRRILVRAQRPA